jgi:integrase
MANRTVTLYIRIKTADGKKPFCKPVYLTKGRLKPLYAIVDGQPEHRPEGVYYMRFGTAPGMQMMEPLGQDPYFALDKVAEKQRWLRKHELGMVEIPSEKPKQEIVRVTLASAVEMYFKNLHSQGKDPKTIRAYRVAINEFLQSCSKKFLDEIGKQDLLDFMGWLRNQPPKLRKDGTPRKARKSGDPNRTYFNKVNDIVIFLSSYGINRLLKKCQYPKFAEKPVVFYDSQQCRSLYGATIDDEERFTLDYFLKTGVRDGEAAHAEYTDVKDGFLSIVDKPHLRWHPKHWHIRRIPIPQDLVAAIAERQKRNPGSTLIFPNRAGNPDQHLLRVVQRVAKRAGNAFHADLHTFRRTYATLFSGTTKIQTIQYLLGHKDIKTTMRYLGIPDLNSPETRRAVEETFKEFTPPQTTASAVVESPLKWHHRKRPGCSHRAPRGLVFRAPSRY